MAVFQLSIIYLRKTEADVGNNVRFFYELSSSLAES